MAEQNALDGIADELFAWMDSEVQYYADALKGGPNGRAPFSADASESERHAFFTRKMFTEAPDGTIQYDKPNAEGRAFVMQNYGPQQYGEIWDQVRPKAGRRPVVQSDPDLEGEED